MMKIMLRIFLFLVLIGCTEYGSAKQLAAAGSNEIKDSFHFEDFSSSPLVLKYGNVKGVKAILDLQTNQIHYINGKYYKYHVDYCKYEIRWRGTHSDFNQFNYHPNSKQRFLCGNINYYSSLDVYVLEFSAANELNSDQLVRFYKIIRKTFIPKAKLKVLADMESAKKLLKSKPTFPSIKSETLYKGQSFQPLNKAKSVGYLRFIDKDQVMTSSLSENDILVVNGSPNILPVTSGIITSELQSPLSHITLLGINRKIAVFSLKNAWENKKLRQFENKLVQITVNQNNFNIRASSVEEQKKFLNKSKKKIRLRKNLNVQRLMSLRELDHLDVNKVGGKAANFGELAKINLPEAKIPEGAFAIPFFFYDQHIKQSGAQKLIDSLLNDPTTEFKDSILLKIRNTIKSCPIDETLLGLVTTQIKIDMIGPRRRFRSSTNAEDIESFNGAGLYESKTGIMGSTKKPLDMAIKKVWASLWLSRAYDERVRFGINQENVAMGILVHQSFPDESANGVAISKNLYRTDYPGFTISVQKGEESVVSPKQGVVCDHFVGILKKELSFVNRPLMIDWVSKSSINKGKPVLKDHEILSLLKTIDKIKQHYILQGYFEDVNEYRYGLDIEFKFDGENRDLFIKQVRYFNN